MHAALHYLSSEQPQGLQQLCSCAFRQFISVDADLVWLVLQQLVPSSLPTPTHPALKPFKFPEHPNSALFIANVQPLLHATFN